MLRKSLSILITAALVVLGAIVAYAALRLSPPTAMLARAEQMLRDGSPALAIKELDLAERSAPIVNDAAARERLWRLRYAAYVALDNPAGALHDIALLLQQGHRDDETLLLDQIRLLAQNAEGERARLAAIAFLEQHPGHARALELAGEACQTLYQPLLRQARELIDLEIGRDDVALAREALLSHVYRPAGDPEVLRAHAALQRAFAVEPRLVAMWPTVEALLADVRQRVQEGLTFFQQALDAGEQPVAAFRAVAGALERSGRIDDLLVACELQRIHFDHAYVDESGVIAAWLHLRNHQDHAALASVGRWLGSERIAARAADGTLTGTTGDLLFARSLAAFRLADQKALNAINQDVMAVREAGGKATMALHLTQAARRMLAKNPDPQAIERNLAELCRRLLLAPVATGRPDPAEEFVPLLLDHRRQRGAAEAEVLALLRDWHAARPDSVVPLLAATNYLLSLGRATAALDTIAQIAGLEPDHPQLFALRLAASRQHYRDTRNDGPGLLNQCALRRQELPDIEDPIGYFLCAEAALAQRSPQALVVAATCARSAVDAFPLAAPPRRLLIQALLARQRVTDALREVERAIATVRPDAALSATALRAVAAANAPREAVLHWVLPLADTSLEVQGELLDQALRHTPHTAARFVTEAMLLPDAPDELRLAAVRALCHDGQSQRAATVLDTFAATVPGAPRSDALAAALLTAFADWLAAAAARSDDGELLATACARHDRLALDAAPQAPLLRTIATLENSHPRTAYALLRTALPAARADERTGADFARAGRLALQHADFATAEQHWTAALGFADGSDVAEDLARLLIATGRAERAAAVYTFVTTPRDAALAARFGRLDLASGLLAAALLRDPGDLLVHATLATFGQPSLVDWQAATDELQTRRIELLACLANPHLALLVLHRAQALVAAQPTLRTNHLMLAHALADAGQPAAAATIHAGMFVSGFTNAVLWREIAYAAQHPDYHPGEELLQGVMTAATTGGTGGSPLTLSFGTAAFVDRLAAAGLGELADQSRLLLWLGAPQAQPCARDDVDLIARGHPPALACTILDRVLREGRPLDRRYVIDGFYQLAERAARIPAQTVILRSLAEQHLAREGALGPIVHFLLAHPGEAATADRTFDLLGAHLRQVAAGGDDQRWLAATVEALVAAVGLDAAIEHVEPVLRSRPTAIPLWLARADLQCRARRDGSAVAELRSVLSHCDDPEATLALLRLAGAHHALQPGDRERFAALPQELRDYPRGRYAHGLLLLGEGEAAAALPLLEGAAAQPDGRHLFALAAACLEQGAPQSVARARDLFAQLTADYPSSDLARNAGSFVRQLSPRAPAAPPSESNR